MHLETVTFSKGKKKYEEAVLLPTTLFIEESGILQ